eukprot:1669553-Amphidinium_carterae.1
MLFGQEYVTLARTTNIEQVCTMDILDIFLEGLERLLAFHSQKENEKNRAGALKKEKVKPKPGPKPPPVPPKGKGGKQVATIC